MRDLFTTIRTEGAILPADLLARIGEGDRDLKGLSPGDYHLHGEQLNEAVSRSWNRLLGTWTAFQTARGKLASTDPGTTVTRERWLLPLFQELGYGRLLAAKAVEIDGKSYPLSHGWQHSPIHLVGCQVDIDRRTARVSGAAHMSPHSLVQELLNRADDHLWGFVANGLRLRILRDNVSLTRQAYVEFDLEAMMQGEVYADFVLLWLLCHESRVEAERPEQCWLEQWSKNAQQRGVRALDDLRKGVERAITALGSGFLAHPANAELRDKLRSGTLDKQEYYRQVLRTVYRLLFIFVAEDRGLLLDPQASPDSRERYTRYYSTARLRRLAGRRRGTQHADLWRGLSLVFGKLGSDDGCPALALPALGSFLWSNKAVIDLTGCEIANGNLLEAVRALAFVESSRQRRVVDYRNLGSEELGSVYESLLELHPELNLDARAFRLNTAGGNERKTTGSYYTPTSLITCLLDSALDPVLDEAAKQPDPEAAILALKVCDPACGSGHFLIAAAHRMAKRLAAVKTGDDEPSPEATRAALRDVIGHCIYGVDINPMAVELCKVSLWMEALEPGKPLSFLDHRIQVGNSLLGTTPALLAGGIPDAAFTPIEGDDRKYVTDWKKQNREQRKGQLSFDEPLLLPWDRLGDFATAMQDLDREDDSTIAGIRRKQQRWEKLVLGTGYEYSRLWADAWCAAFVWKKTKAFSYPITENVFREIERSPYRLAPWMKEEIQRLARQYRFFHWHLAFPDVFQVPAHGAPPENEQARWSGGFDVVLGNPPWERIKLQEKEWFAERAPEIANAPNAAARRRMIESLKKEDPALSAAFLEDRRQAEGESHLVRDSDRYPLCGRGDVNTYSIFAETNRLILGPTGRVGCIVPSGIATDDTTKFFFQDLMETGSLANLYDFENRDAIFPGVHRSYKFCLLTLAGQNRPGKREAEFAFFLHNVEDLREGDRRFALTAADLALLNPNTRTCPIFRSKRDAEVTKAIYRRVPVLIDDSRTDGNPWSITVHTRLFHMAEDSEFFRTGRKLEASGWIQDGNAFTRHGEQYLPLYEAKMFHHFDHRWATYDEAGNTRELRTGEKRDPVCLVFTRYWVPEQEVTSRLQHRWVHTWLLGWRDITNSTNERTMISTILPPAAVGDTVLLMFPIEKFGYLLPSCLNSFAVDFATRQKLGGTHLKLHIFKQLPVMLPRSYDAPAPWSQDEPLSEWMSVRTLELVYTAWDLESFGRDCGYDGPPFRWYEERRFLLRCELDAAYFHLYGIERDDVDYIMETFPIVKRKDGAAHGEYRTKRVILEIYDEMAEATRTGEPYKTRLDPPPADPRVAHPVPRSILAGD